MSEESPSTPSTNNLHPSVRKKWGYILYLLALFPIGYGWWISEEGSQMMRLVKAYYESSEQAICIIDGEGNVVKGFWSKGCEKLFGWSSSEAYEKNIVMLIPMNMLARHSEKFDDRIKRIKDQGIRPDEKTMVVRCEAMTKGLDKVDLRITIRFFEFEGEPYMNTTFDIANEVEFLKSPPSTPIQSSSSIFTPIAG